MRPLALSLQRLERLYAELHCRGTTAASDITTERSSRGTDTPVRTTALVLGLIVLLGGCTADGAIPGASSSASPAGPRLIVQDVGFAMSAIGSTKLVNAVAVIKNDSTQVADVSVTFFAYDDAGREIAQTLTSAPTARAGASVAATAPLSIAGDAQVARMEATASSLRWKDDVDPDQRFTAASAKFAGRLGAEDSGTVAGSIASTYEVAVRNASVSAVCRDEKENIIGGGQTFVDVAARGEAAVEVPVAVQGPPSSCEIFAALGDGSSLAD